MFYEVVSVEVAGTNWPDSGIQHDIGPIPGLMRGYNLEVVKGADSLDYAGMVCTYGEPVSENPDIEPIVEMCLMNNTTPTGRLVFRGYFSEDYDAAVGRDVVRRIPDRDFQIYEADLNDTGGAF